MGCVMMKGWGCRGTADLGLPEAEQRVPRWQLPPALAAVGSAVPAAESAEPSSIAQRHHWDRERVFLVSADRQA